MLNTTAEGTSPAVLLLVQGQGEDRLLLEGARTGGIYTILELPLVLSRTAAAIATASAEAPIITVGAEPIHGVVAPLLGLRICLQREF